MVLQVIFTIYCWKGFAQRIRIQQPLCDAVKSWRDQPVRCTDNLSRYQVFHQVFPKIHTVGVLLPLS